MAIPAEFNEEDQLLQSILQQQGAANWTLPHLKADRNLFQEWLDNFWKWLGKYFHFPQPQFDIPFTKEDFEKVLTGVVVLLFLVLVYWIVRQIWLGRNEGYATPRATGSALSVENLETVYINLIRQALEEGQPGLAARIRWKLFLFRMRAEESLTPLEFFRTEASFPVLPCYRLMFREERGPLEGFRTIDSKLAELESGGPAGV